MIQSGDSSVHFTKVKPMQLAEIKSVLQRRPKTKFSMGLSPEAQEAMQQVAEETKVQQASRRGKRGSKGNVLFSDTIHIREEAPTPRRRPSVDDILEDSFMDYTFTNNFGALLDGQEAGSLSPRRTHGRRRSSVTSWVSTNQARRSSINSISEVDVVESANRITTEEDSGVKPDGD